LANLFWHILVSIAIFAALLYYVDASAVASSILSSDPVFLLLAFISYAAVNMLMAFRMHSLLTAMKSAIPFRQVLSSHYLGMLASDFTPARAGYFASAFSLNAKGVPLSRAISAILAPQTFDFLLKAGASAVAIVFLATYLGLPNAALLPAIAAIIVIFAFVLIIVSLLFIPKLSKPFLPYLKLLPFGGKIKFMAEKMHENAPLMRAKLPLIGFILASTWILKGMEWYMLSLALGMKANYPVHPFLFFLFLQPIATIVQFIPTPTPAGAGLSEAGTVGIMALFGANPPVAAAFGILARALMLSQDWIGLFEWKNLRLDFLDEKKW